MKDALFLMVVGCFSLMEPAVSFITRPSFLHKPPPSGVSLRARSSPSEPDLPAISRRREFLNSLALSSGAVILSSGEPAFADVIGDERLLTATALELKTVVQNLDSFTTAVASETSEVKLPSQVPRTVFQRLEKNAHDVTVRDAAPDGSDDGFFPAEDFMAVATDYAEHAGAARDLFKLSKLGRSGENGSEEVAKNYAKRCADEVRAASALLGVLALAVKQ